MSQLTIFFASIIFGALAKLLFVAVTIIEKKTKLIAVTIIMDTLLSAVLVLCYAALIFLFCNGIIYPHSVLGVVIGIALTPIHYPLTPKP